MKHPISHPHTNWYGLWTLYEREVARFIKVYNQTLIAPTVTSLLFLAIFSLALNGRSHHIGDVPFQEFMAAGLIMMTMIQQAFANTSSSYTFGKVLGTIIDYLMPPLNSGQILFAMVMAGLTRGLMIGALCAVCISFFVPLHLHHFGHLLFYAIVSCLVMALFGMVAGIFADTFDQMAAITSYIITPLAFLSGTFYSIENLPSFWYHVTHYNPFFYMLDGFRYALTGHADSDIHVGMIYLSSLAVLLWLICYQMLRTGYRIKS